MIVVDAHQDIAFNALAHGRDYRRSAWDIRRREGAGSRAMIGLPDAILGRVGLVFATLFTAPHDGKRVTPWDAVSYRDPKGAYRVAMRQLDYYQRLADETDKVRLIQTSADLDALLGSWADGKEIAEHKHGLVLLMENADPILEPKQFEEWYERGVRIVGPAWQGTRYAGGTGQPGPLTTLGYELLEIMASFNAILDISHLAEQACLQALDFYPGTIIASHSNPRKFRDIDRNLSELAIRRLAERDGVMGVVLYNPFLNKFWSATSRRNEVGLKLVVDAVDYVCQLTGSAAHVGIGSDFDGGFGSENAPMGLETVSDLLLIGEALRDWGYTPDDVEAIMGGNMLRKLRGALPAG